MAAATTIAATTIAAAAVGPCGVFTASVVTSIAYMALPIARFVCMEVVE